MKMNASPIKTTPRRGEPAAPAPLLGKERGASIRLNIFSLLGVKRVSGRTLVKIFPALFFPREK
jgi:hypothetical protein